ncbi:MAG: S8 family serine peptidase [Gammaproteobacteria bacterium]
MSARRLPCFVIPMVVTLSACGGSDGSDGGGSGGGNNSVSVSGVISAAGATAIDGDVNDPLAPLIPNNTPEASQVLPNPVTVGGFATLSGTGGANDVFASTGDPVDSYRVTLIHGQSVSLTISDHAASNPNLNNLDILVYAAGDRRTVVASSLGSGPVESVTFAGATGQYDIVVQAVSGTSNYLLDIGLGATVVSTDALRLEHDFVPGEVIVEFKNTVLPANVRNTLSSRAASVGMTPKGGGPGRAMLLSMAEENQRRQALGTMGIQPTHASDSFNNDTQRLKYDTIKVVNAMRARADVLTADLNYIYEPLLVPNDEFYAFQWHYPLINLPQTWDITTGSADVIVAVVDTGAFFAHPDLEGTFTDTGYDFISDPAIAGDGDGRDADPTDPGDNPNGGSSFHGSHVSGTVAAATNNATGVGGVAWQSKVMPVRALGIGGGLAFDLIQSQRYAAGLTNDTGIILPPEQRADVINMSLGRLGAASAAEQATINDIRNAGVFVVAASGNAGNDALNFPAAYDGVISVSAIDLNKQRAPYSTFGATVDVAAPGGNVMADDNADNFADGVLSTGVDDSAGDPVSNYPFFNGTSMAAPHVAGVIALMKAVYPQLTPAQFDSLLAAGVLTEDLGGAGHDNEYGYGMIDALKAVNEAGRLAAGGELPPVLSAQPASLNFGSALPGIELTLANGGAGAIAIQSIVESADWLTVTPTAVDAVTGLGTYNITVDRAGLVDSGYNTQLVVNAGSGGPLNIPVIMQVNTGRLSDAADTGAQIVLLLDTATGQAVYREPAVKNGRSYTYSFTGVAPGNYLVQATSDLDNDAAVCDPGEACGGFPTVSGLQAITVGASDVRAINFSSSFAAAVGARSAQGELKRLARISHHGAR